MPAKLLPLVLSAFCAVMPALAVMASNWMPPVLVAAALAALLALWQDARRGSLPAAGGVGGAGRRALAEALRPRFSPALLLCILLLAWAGVASLWSYEVGSALFLVFRLGLLGAAGCFLFGIALRLAPAERRQVARWLGVGFAFGIGLFGLERLTGSALHQLLGHPDPDRSLLSTLNRGATGLALLVWPVTASLLRGPLGRVALVLPAALLVLLLAFESQSAILGIMTGLATLLLALASRRAALGLCLLVVLGGVLAAPPVAKLIYTPNGYSSGWIEHNAQHRLFIWDFVADRVLERPLAGWGFDASGALPEAGVRSFGLEPSRIPSHPHNAALQIWLELGLVGIVLTVGFLLAVLCRIAGLAESDFAATTALFVAGLAMAWVSYGIWQNQWIAALLGAAIAAVAARGETPRRAEAGWSWSAILGRIGP